MYLAPLNYDRFFKKVFSDSNISKKFLEDFFDVQIDSIELLENKHKLTDGAQTVEFDFRCKIEGNYVIVDMQQWYKSDIVKRFYLYHTVNTALQLEKLPIKSVLISDFIVEKKDNITELKPVVKNTRDYSGLEPVITLIWMVGDTLHFKEDDYIAYTMAPEIALDFIKNDEFWQNKEIREMQRKKVLEVLANKNKNLDFLHQNRLIYAFQHNIVKNSKLQKYVRWFEFAEQTRKRDNKAEEFVKYQDDIIFNEMMRRLRKDFLSQEDSEYIDNFEEITERAKRWEEGIRREGLQEGREEGREQGWEQGREEGWEQGREEGWEQGREEGLNKGIQEGMLKKSIDTAKKLIYKGMTNEDIAELTDLSINDIIQIRNENNRNL